MRQSATLPVGESEEKAQEEVRETLALEGASGHPFQNLGRFQFQTSREALYRCIP
jgi:hypothetical protein